MGPIEAFTSAYKNYFQFHGRARRSEYWWFILIYMIIFYAIFGIEMATYGGSILALIFALASLLPGIGLVVRRLHDSDRSGFWYFIALIPLIGAIVLLIFLILDGTPGPNKYGADPKGRAAVATPEA